MPKNKNALMRYRIIDACLRNKFKRYPNKFDFMRACENLGAISLRTVEKDIYDMMYDEELAYNAPIVYSRAEKGYYYDDPNYSINQFPIQESDLSALEFACSILRQFGNIDPARQLLESIDKMETFMRASHSLESDSWQLYIQAEKSLGEGGMDFMGPILDAIRSKNKCFIKYQRFNSEEKKSYIFHPYVLKQYRNRWYVIGYFENRKASGTFALDRIQSLEPLKENFIIDKNFSSENYFKYSFGISVQQSQKPEKIKLSFHPNEAPFIKSQPLHQSQKIVLESEKEFIIELEVWIGFELINSILGFGKQVKILEPLSLQQEIIEHYKNALNLYP
jgi:predicted DNA-binding transcriptional regulator YafY